jgi:hypothetical protein
MLVSIHSKSAATSPKTIGQNRPIAAEGPSPQDRKLLPKRHVFQEQIPATAKELGKWDK